MIYHFTFIILYQSLKHSKFIILLKGAHTNEKMHPLHLYSNAMHHLASERKQQPAVNILRSADVRS